MLAGTSLVIGIFIDTFSPLESTVADQSPKNGLLSTLTWILSMMILAVGYFKLMKKVFNFCSLFHWIKWRISKTDGRILNTYFFISKNDEKSSSYRHSKKIQCYDVITPTLSIAHNSVIFRYFWIEKNTCPIFFAEFSCSMTMVTKRGENLTSPWAIANVAAINREKGIGSIMQQISWKLELHSPRDDTNVAMRSWIPYLYKIYNNLVV